MICLDLHNTEGVREKERLAPVETIEVWSLTIPEIYQRSVFSLDRRHQLFPIMNYLNMMSFVKLFPPKLEYIALCV